MAIIGSDIEDFTTDNLGNIYMVNSRFQMKKLKANGDSMGVFNDVRKYGKLYALDATNPLKLLLYYKDFGTVVVVDRLLGVRNVIDLRKENIYQSRAISTSFDNGIWVYDEQEAKLKRLNDDGKVIDQTNDFRQLFDAAPLPVSIGDENKLVYLYDPEKGLYVFDYYGTLKNKVLLTGWSDFQVVGKTVFGRKGSSLFKYQPGTLQMQEYNLPAILNGITKSRVSINYLYCLKEGRIYVYAL